MYYASLAELHNTRGDLLLTYTLRCVLHVAVVFDHLYLQFLNLFVAIIIDNFDYLVKDKSVLGAHQLSTFVKLWSIYDPSARSVYYTNYIRVLARGKGAMYNPHLAKHIGFCKANRNERRKKKGGGGIKKRRGNHQAYLL